MEGRGAASTISPALASPSSPGGTVHSALERRSVGTMRPPPPRGGVEHAEHAAGRVGQAFQRAAFIFAGADRGQPGQHALAGRQCRTAARLGRHQHQRRRAVAVPVHRAGDRVAIRVGAGDPHHHGVRQPAGRGDAAAAGRGHLAFGGHGLQQVAQVAVAGRRSGRIRGRFRVCRRGRGTRARSGGWHRGWAVRAGRGACGPWGWT